MRSSRDRCQEVGLENHATVQARADCFRGAKTGVVIWFASTSLAVGAAGALAFIFSKQGDTR